MWWRRDKVDGVGVLSSITAHREPDVAFARCHLVARMRCLFSVACSVSSCHVLCRPAARRHMLGISSSKNEIAPRKHSS